MNGLEKSIHELINMLVQYEATTHKSEPAVLVGEASTSKAKGKGARRWKRKKRKGTAVTATASTGGAPPAAPKGKGKGKVGGSQMMCACIAKERGIERGSVHNSSPTQVLERSRTLSKDEIILRLGDGKAVAAEAVGSFRLIEKMTKNPFVGQSAVANDLLDLVHTDVCGPLSIPARGGFSYFITFTDDHSPYGYIYLMRYKSEVFESTPTPYEIWHGKPASYKYLRVWGSPAYVKRLVGDKLDSRSSLCRFIGYPKETAGYYFYDPAKQKIFVSRNAVFLKKGFSSDNRRDKVLIEESSGEPHHDSTISFEPTVHTDGVLVLRRSTRESRIPERYGFVRLTSQLNNDPKTYGEAMSDMDSDKWLEAIKSEMDSMGSNQVWTLIDPPKGARPVGCKWVYKRKLETDGEVTAFKARLLAKGYTQRPRVDFEELIRQ
ncbi:UNVERIFIED_CONTAM: putative mitochondrial protein [Sesamum latifolium]|uniref:Mitochondrial protein n=1 Tax=Sesamum latifolium TaxID=2727402 RepID=A0AAW2SQT4_9LAMI